MVGQCCCINNCHSRSHHRSGGKLENGIRFFAFPKWKKHEGAQVEEMTRRRRMSWVAAVGRKKITFNNIPASMKVCSLHFQSGQPAYEMLDTHPDWTPSLLLGHNEVKVTDKERCSRQSKKNRTQKRVRQEADTAQNPDDQSVKECALCKSRDDEINRLLEENRHLKHEREMTEQFFMDDDSKDHFEQSQYESRRMDNLRKLKPNAIPTKFAHFKKKKSLHQIVANLTKTLLPERLSVEHSYSQSSDKGPSQKEDNGDLFNIDDDPGENILKPESFALPQHCVFARPLDHEDLTTAQCEASIEPRSKQTEEQFESGGPVVPDSTPAENTNSVDCEMTHLKDIIKKKDERIAMLLKAVVNERREKLKLEREKQNLIQNIETVFNANQLARLGRKSGRGVKWSSETLEKARQLRATCGVKGYMLLRAQNQPLPSLRCLRKMTPMKKKRLVRDGVDCLQATIGVDVDGAYVEMVMQ